MLKSRKPKQWEAVSDDPRLPYQMGRLVGAAEMASLLLANQDSPDVKLIGEYLARAVGWFFEPGDRKELEQ